MVIPLGPGKFYGSSLPRPRIYTDVKHNADRVDPPMSVLDPFLSWANEAHWSMGGLSFKRLRLQGRIEGSIKGLRNEREKLTKKQNTVTQNTATTTATDPVPKNGKKGKKRVGSVSPPPAPVVAKRRRFLALSDEDESENEEEEEKREKGRVTRRLVRKLGDDFDRVADKDGEKGSRSRKGDAVMKKVKGEGGDGVGSGVRSSPRLVKGKGKGDGESGTRTSPRLVNRRG